MSVDDTLELDTIIKESTIASDPITEIRYEGSKSNEHSQNGIQTHTEIFRPKKSGTYEIDVNGQTLKIKVISNNIIPDSAIHRWKFNEGSGSTATDSIGSADATLSTTSMWINGDWNGGYAVGGDGSDDSVDLTTLGSFGSNLGTGFAIAFTIQHSSISQSEYIGTYNGSNQLLRITGSRFNSGGLTMELRDDSGNNNQVHTSSGSIFDDNKKHRVVVQTSEPSKSSKYEVYNNTNSLSLSINKNQGADNFSNFDTPLSTHYLPNFGQYFNGIIDDIIIYDSALSSKDIQSDYNAQSWI